jgi:hypothetical protein
LPLRTPAGSYVGLEQIADIYKRTGGLSGLCNRSGFLRQHLPALFSVRRDLPAGTFRQMSTQTEAPLEQSTGYEGSSASSFAEPTKHFGRKCGTSCEDCSLSGIRQATHIKLLLR